MFPVILLEYPPKASNRSLIVTSFGQHHDRYISPAMRAQPPMTIDAPIITFFVSLSIVASAGQDPIFVQF